MAIVIGAATQVSFAGACVLSANWSYNPNVERLYCIGEWVPSQVFYRPTESLSLTIYAPGPTYDVAPSTSCVDANTISASVTPAACGESYPAMSGSWLVNQYSYSKEDAAMAGQETWSLTRWKSLSSSLPGGTIEPTYVLRGIAEGEGTMNAGIVFEGTTITSYNGSVSANSFGRADTVYIGVVSLVGGGSSAAGETGQGSVSIPYTPLYI